MGIEVPFLSYEEIKSIAEKFLSEYHPEGSIPVPIEEIIELSLELDIFPIPNLQNILDTVGCSAYRISTIFIDQFVFEKRINRYRFTLAHETAHFIIHEMVLKECGAESSKEVMEFIRSIPEGSHSRMEYQAYAFAGLVLVPTQNLELAIFEALSKLPKNLELTRYAPEILEYISKFIGDKFQVSADVIKKRIENESRLKKYFDNLTGL